MSTTGIATDKQIEYARNFIKKQYQTPPLNISTQLPKMPNKSKIQAKSYNDKESSDDDDEKYVTVNSIKRDKPPIKEVRQFYKDTIEELNNFEDD